MTRILFAGRLAEGETPQLWVSDATPAGTRPLMDINPGQDNGLFALLGDGRAVLSADDGALGRELWVSDGSRNGTFLVKDINPGSGHSNPRELTPLGDGRVLFSADDGTHGRELWITDGTHEGTAMVRDINPGAGDSLLVHPLSSIYYPVYLTPLGDGRAVFRADDGTHGFELWVTDGTEAGTMMVQDINPGAAGSDLDVFTAMGDGRVVFRANDGVHGAEPWITDGTPEGTFMLMDTRPGGSGQPMVFFRIGDGRMMFHALEAPGTGREFYLTDGTPEGTGLLKDINPGRADAVSLEALGLRPALLPDGRVIFPAEDGIHGREPWITDGTEEGTFLLKDINPGSATSAPRFTQATIGGQLLFSAIDGTHGREPWITDGTEEGTRLLKDINPGSASSAGVVISFTVLPGDRAIFTANDGTHGSELWVTDGTEDGTRMLADILPGPGSSSPGSRRSLDDGRVVFMARNEDSELRLWITDGTEDGTYQLQDSGTITGAVGYHMIVLGDVTPGGDDQISGIVTDPSGNPLSAVQVTHGDTVTTIDAAGGFSLALPPDVTGRVEFSRDWQEDDPPVNASDALEVLRLAVGLAPSWGTASPLHFIAADFDGNGRVEASDALDVLRVAVGLPSAYAPRWVFIDSDADLSAINAGNVSFSTGIDASALTAGAEIGVTAILTGVMQEHL